MWNFLDEVPTQISFTLIGAASMSVLRFLFTRIKETTRQKRLERKNQVFASQFKNNVFSFGGLTSSVFVADIPPRGYSSDTLICELVNDSSIPDVIEDDTFREAHEKWSRAVESGEIFNGNVFALHGFRLPRTAEFEQSGLRLAFRPSDYVTQRATGDMFRSLARDVRVAEANHIRQNPGAAGRFSATFGTPLVVVTADNQLMWLKRSNASAVNGGRYTCTTAEGLNRDDLRSGIPDPYLCAARGLHEEIGIRLNTNEISRIRFIAMLLDLDWWEWTLVGIINLADLAEHALESQTLRQYFSSARAKDKWETGEPDFCDFTPDGVANFIKSHQVTNYGAVSAVLALFSSDNFRREEIFRSFKNLKMHIGDFDLTEY